MVRDLGIDECEALVADIAELRTVAEVEAHVRDAMRHMLDGALAASMLDPML